MTETKLPLDAGTICALLGIEAGPLADIFRHEAARLMRVAADRVEEGVDTTHDPVVKDVRLLLALVEALEDEWSITHPEIEDDGVDVERALREESDRAASATRRTEATPRRPEGETPPQSQGDMVSDSMRRLGGDR